MEVKLINGEFNSDDAIKLISQLIKVKINYHENKIDSNSNEEDIKVREKKINQLQNELAEIIKQLDLSKQTIKINSTIKIE